MTNVLTGHASLHFGYSFNRKGNNQVRKSTANYVQGPRSARGVGHSRPRAPKLPSAVLG